MLKLIDQATKWLAEQGKKIPLFNEAVAEINEFSKKLSNWILFEDGFESDSSIALKLGTNTITESESVRAVRLWWGDTSANTPKEMLRKHVKDLFSKNENDIATAHLLTRLGVGMLSWLMLGSLIGNLIPASLSIILAPLPLAVAVAGMRAGFDTMTYFGFNVKEMLQQNVINRRANQNTNRTTHHDEQPQALHSIAQEGAGSDYVVGQGQTNPFVLMRPAHHKEQHNKHGNVHGRRYFTMRADKEHINDDPIEDSDNDDDSRYRYQGGQSNRR